MAVAAVVLIVFVAYGVWAACKVAAMSDADREAYGLGPKGQGREYHQYTPGTDLEE